MESLNSPRPKQSHEHANHLLWHQETEFFLEGQTVNSAYYCDIWQRMHENSPRTLVTKELAVASRHHRWCWTPSKNKTSRMHLENGRRAGNGAYTQKGTTSSVTVASRSKVSFLTRWHDWLWAGWLRDRSSSPSRDKNFNFSISSRPALRSTQPPIHWVPGALSLVVKWQGSEADHSPQTNAEVKKTWNYTSTLPYAFMA
jgi:hypothetical protein